VNRNGIIRSAIGVGVAAALLGGPTAIRAQTRIPESQARAAALAHTPGTILETELDRYAGRNAYEFKIRPSNGGLAIDVHVDAASGTVLGVGDDTEPDADNGSGRVPGRAAAQPQQPEPAYQEDFNVAARALSDTGEGPYFVLRPGFQSVLSDGDTTLTITVFNETRMVGGTLTRVVEERQVTYGLPDEIALNFYAIDPATGDAFYFGEEVDVFQNGQLSGHPGVWLAEGASRPGMIMPGNPLVGMRYYQELAPGVAMDRGEVLSVSDVCSTPAGEFGGCLVVRETSAIEDFQEVKRFAPGVGVIQDGELLLVSYGYVDPER
jgi:hypothetical protein